MNNTNNGTARDSYIQAKKMFFKAFRDKFPDGILGDKRCAQFVEDLKLSQGAIRLEVALSATQNTFVFGVTPNQANSNNIQYNTERRLPLQDSICVSEYAIYVGKPSSSTDTNWLLRTYGNTQDFSAGAAASIDSTFYSHSWFVMKCNNDVLVPYRGLKNHWYKGETQQTSALGAGSPGDQVRGAQDGLITQEPNLIIIGSKNYVPQIEMPTAMGTVDANTRAVLIMSGVYAQNSTVVS